MNKKDNQLSYDDPSDYSITLEEYKRREEIKLNDIPMSIEPRRRKYS